MPCALQWALLFCLHSRWIKNWFPPLDLPQQTSYAWMNKSLTHRGFESCWLPSPGLACLSKQIVVMQPLSHAMSYLEPQVKAGCQVRTKANPLLKTGQIARGATPPWHPVHPAQYLVFIWKNPDVPRSASACLLGVPPVLSTNWPKRDAAFAVTLYTVVISDSKLGPFWTMILDSGKQWMVSDKFLASATDESE